MEDTSKNLKRLEQELMDEERRAQEERIIEELLQEQKAAREAGLLDESAVVEKTVEGAVPAFEDPEKIHEPAEPMVYRNYSNAYGKGEKAAVEKVSDKQIMVLMGIASFFGLGIVALLVYWLTTLLA